MYTAKQINRFLQLRAQNHSYDNLSHLLNIPKRTLLRWGKEHAGKIEMLKKRSFDKLFKELDVSVRRRIEMLAKDLKKINKELKNKSYCSVIAIDLLKMKMKLISALAKYDTANDEEVRFDFQEQSISDPYDYDEEGTVHIPDNDEEEEEFNRKREQRDRIRKRLEEENPGVSEDELDNIEFEFQLNRELARNNQDDDDPNDNEKEDDD